jgi:hypothetical protein
VSVEFITLIIVTIQSRVRIKLRYYREFFLKNQTRAWDAE